MTMHNVLGVRMSAALAASMHTAVEERFDESRHQACVRRYSRLHLWPHEALCTKAAPVRFVSELPEGLLDGMGVAVNRPLFSLRAGAGIAANQVGAPVRACLVRVGEKYVTMVNPVIIDHGTTTVWRAEGCLSIPGFVLTVQRHTKIRVKYLDEMGNGCQLELDDEDHFPRNAVPKTHSVVVRNEAQCVQHEIDHMNGICVGHRATARQQRRKLERCLADARAHPDYDACMPAER